MRRAAVVLLAFVLGLALAAPAAGALDAPTPSVPSSEPAVPVATFCRSTARLLRFIAGAPDPRKLNSVRGRRVLRALHRDAPPDVQAPAKTVVDSFGYLSRHGLHTLSKQRDARTGDALLRVALYGATHCGQRRIRQFAQGLAQRRLAQAEAARQATTTSTSTPR